MSELKVKKLKSGTQVSGKMEWRCIHEMPADKWVGICDALSLTVQADSRRELHAEIWDTMETLFQVLIKERKFDRFLKQHGWVQRRGAIQKVADLFNALPVNILFGEEELAGAAA